MERTPQEAMQEYLKKHNYNMRDAERANNIKKGYISRFMRYDCGYRVAKLICDAIGYYNEEQIMQFKRHNCSGINHEKIIFPEWTKSPDISNKIREIVQSYSLINEEWAHIFAENCQTKDDIKEMRRILQDNEYSYNQNSFAQQMIMWG